MAPTNLAKQVDVESLMREIREEVSATLGDSSMPRFRPAVVDSRPLSPVIHSEELHYLNAHWSDWHSPAEFVSHRKFLSPIIVRIKRFLVHIVWTSFMRDYVERERKYQMNLVRFLNSTAKYIDQRDTEIVLKLVRKIEEDLESHGAVVERTDATLRSVELEISKRLALAESTVDKLNAEVLGVQSGLERLDQMTRGLERVLSLLGRAEQPKSSSRESASTAEMQTQSDSGETRQFQSGVDYLLLENRFRGSEDLIRGRMQDYVEIFRGARGPVCDVGCGRGELLELFREANIESFGIDLDDSMVAWSKRKGLAVTHGDALTLLEQRPDSSLGGLIACQVVEHLTKDQLENFIDLARRKVAPGGAIVFETINPNSVFALSRNFFRDPTHVWPVHPETLQFVMEMKGITNSEIRLRSPYPKEALLQELQIDGTLPGRWNDILSRINSSFGKLNELLFGHQDYCVIGRVPQ